MPLMPVSELTGSSYAGKLIACCNQKWNVSMKTLALATAAIALALPPAHAGSLINKDSSSYDIAVKTSGGTNRTSISGNTTKSGICSSSCTIEVSGVGKIELGSGDDAIIKNGRLEKN